MPEEEGSPEQSGNRRWQFGWCEYVEDSNVLLVNGTPIRMESKPLKVLQCLLLHPEVTLSKAKLLETVWQSYTTEQSLPTAIMKLRRAMGGERDAIIVSVASRGYRMGVPVFVKANADRQVSVVQLKPGDPVPGHPEWIVTKSLGAAASGVWLTHGKKTLEQRVFKFAVAESRLRALRREVEISRLLQRSFGEHATFLVRILSWNLKEPPFFTESEYGGVNLRQFATTEDFDAVPMEARVELVAQIADAVEAAHSIGILHNDLKPENILVERAGEMWQVKVADFGVASFADPDYLRQLGLTHHDAFEKTPSSGSPRHLGTPAYWPPELQSDGVPTVKCDVYAIGVLLYQVVCGDLQQTPSPGWQAKIPDPLLREDIAAAANVDPKLRIGTAREIAQRLHSLNERRQERSAQEADAVVRERQLQQLERARVRRPWIVLAAASLLVAFAIAAGYSVRAARQRDLIRAQYERLSAMNRFVTQDIIAQADPYSGVLPTLSFPNQTLVDALLAAVPRMNARFQHTPDVAAPLDETMGDAFRNRSRFGDADEEYSAAAKHYREAEGPASEHALIAEFKRESSDLTSQQSGALAAVKQRYASQAAAVAKIQHPSPEVIAWQAFVNTALVGYSAHPEQALPMISEAIRRAEAAPGFDPAMLISMKMRFCGTYIRLGDGKNVERCAREAIHDLTQLRGADSPALFQPEMFLQEALYMQGRFREAVEQANYNYHQFAKVLGPDHQLTLAALGNRAVDKAQMEDYDGAVADDMAVYAAEERSHADRRMLESSLVDAATYQCHGGHWKQGEANAMQVLEETTNPSSAQPMTSNGARLALAECLTEEAEASAHPKREALASQAQKLLRNVDLKLLVDLSSNPSFEATADVLHARLALIQGSLSEAESYHTKAAPLLSDSSADPLEKRAMTKIDIALKNAK